MASRDCGSKPQRQSYAEITKIKLDDTSTNTWVEDEDKAMPMEIALMRSAQESVCDSGSVSYITIFFFRVKNTSLWGGRCVY